ncbi:MAG: ABC transporter ATP-binding protein [Rhizobiaceae bacterium]
MLEVSGLTAGYGDIIAVRDLSFSVNAGSILSILGANGAGKSSTLMCLMGLVQQKAGSIVVHGEDISDIAVEDRVKRKMSIVPEGRRIFPDLTVEENLVVGGHVCIKSALKQNIAGIYDLFPRLYERRSQMAGSLSGGEQQMLAMGRALISEPELLIVDELSLGLMPKIVDECYAALENLRAEGLGIILVEQNTERALSVADNVCVLEAGNLTWSGTAAEARNDKSIQDSLLGMS